MPDATKVSGARHTLEEHTGELKLRIEAPTLPGIFVEAGRALAEAMATPSGDGPLVTRSFEIEANDREALLADWLNELVFASESEKVIFREFQVELLSERRLRASSSGVKVERLRNPVKAATYHGLAVQERPEGFVATVVLDV